MDGVFAQYEQLQPQQGDQGGAMDGSYYNEDLGED